MSTQHFKDLIVAEINKVLQDAGSDDAQRADAALMLPRYLEIRNGECVVTDTGKPFTKEWVATHKSFLLPRAFEASLAERAFIGRSPAARVDLLRQVGTDAADAIAKSFGLKGHDDYSRAGKKPVEDADKDKSKPSNNPFLKLRDPKTGAINVAVQEQINTMIRTPGPLGGTRFVSGLAKAAGVTLDGRPLRR